MGAHLVQKEPTDILRAQVLGNHVDAPIRRRHGAHVGRVRPTRKIRHMSDHGHASGLHEPRRGVPEGVPSHALDRCHHRDRIRFLSIQAP